MKKYFLLISTLFILASIISCRDDGFYADDTVEFTTKEMDVNVSPTTKSFMLNVKQKGGIYHSGFWYDSDKSTAIVNKHCYLPKMMQFDFPNKATKSSFEIQLYPEKITEILYMTFRLEESGGKDESKFITEIRVKLIPTK